LRSSPPQKAKKGGGRPHDQHVLSDKTLFSLLPFPPVFLFLPPLRRLVCQEITRVFADSLSTHPLFFLNDFGVYHSVGTTPPPFFGQRNLPRWASFSLLSNCLDGVHPPPFDRGRQLRFQVSDGNLICSLLSPFSPSTFLRGDGRLPLAGWTVLLHATSNSGGFPVFPFLG